jgi:hypothetical protein
MKDMMRAISILGVMALCTVGCVTGKYSVVASPDGTKEQFLAKPVHRRIAKAAIRPLEWVVNVVAYPFVGTAIGSLYLDNVSLYVRDRESGKTCRFTPRARGTWSPDSRLIAACGPKPRDERVPIALIDCIVFAERVIPNPDASRNWFPQDMTWSTDGTFLFFRQRTTVYALDVGKETLTVVARNQDGDSLDLMGMGREWRRNAERADSAGQ